MQESPAPTRPSMIVFTDLDGTLLDHDSYSHAAAAPALAGLRAAGIPLVLASSKTAAEIAPLRAELGFAHVPAIVENGAGVLEPGAAAPAGPGDYTRLRAVLEEVPRPLRAQFEGFADLGPEGIARVTGLTGAEARLAATRRFSEPGLWHGGDADRASFIAALSARGVTAREGGRFLTLSFGGTKAAQMSQICARFGNPPALALGDAPNDTEMLETADIGVIVANPHRAPLPQLKGEAEGRIRRTTRPGPAGWNDAVQAAMVELGTG